MSQETLKGPERTSALTGKPSTVVPITTANTTSSHERFDRNPSTGARSGPVRRARTSSTSAATSA